MRTQFMMKKGILPFMLIIALLFPAAAYAAPPAVANFSGAAAIDLNGGVPAFSPADITDEDFAAYSETDELGRAGQATACVSRATLPTGLRADEDEVLPVGWASARYDGLVDGRWLYSICHVISPALSGADSDARNIFTGTRFLHVEGMRRYEDRVVDFITRTTNHVLYRVTPVYRGNDLVPTGVQMEAYSVEDAGRSLSFNVFLYNVQPGIAIDYSDGTSEEDETVEVDFTAAELLRSHELPAPPEMTAPAVGSFSALYEKQMKEAEANAKAAAAANAKVAAANEPKARQFLLNTETMIYHTRNCGHLPTENRQVYTGMPEDVEAMGYSLCEFCRQ